MAYLVYVDLSPQAAQSLGELMVNTLMMGASLKKDETLQVHNYHLFLC